MEQKYILYKQKVLLNKINTVTKFVSDNQLNF